MSDEPEVLTGGNTNPAVLRFGDEVERTAGWWTPAVHDVLRHLEAQGFPAPRSRGYAGERERVTYIPGPVVHPDHWDLLTSDPALAAVFGRIRDLHAALGPHTPAAGARWHAVGADPSEAAEMLCHNDLGPWNLVLSDEGWVFIDWDLLAPGRRDWELAWALMTLIPINPEFGLAVTDVGRRFAVALSAYGVPRSEWPGVMDVVVERVRWAESSIREGAARGDEPWVTLLATGHADVWHNAVLHAEEHHQAWLDVATV
ncbi:MAG: kinase [Frankiales bacterium]|nr:kinase [Frankiales bacterium]